MIGTLTGCLSMISGFLGSRYRDATAFLFGTVAWIASGIGGTLWFETLVQSTWGVPPSNSRGLYLVGFIVFWMFSGAVTTIVLLRKTAPAGESARA
ncbi:MAG TPA: hypothetical protein VMY36_02745 [Patescibacteria group bacterium]|nr:hypothetical protein [Patescibacteria group bacterium]